MTSLQMLMNQYRFSDFLRRTLVNYIDEACATPPARIWSLTRTTECEICEIVVLLTYHHLIPRSTHAKVFIVQEEVAS
ncbi:hypothetical protein M378DRAFT_355522 [Amanita muscaria Koide BX008]|uniref:Uncharacterized protein n=1 Tax=Amanita muscaria (strain Koide BX008) TaxID=946122 RepID=A0A0C2XC35_AMAMK|nr:hypothetical protein M378DRAFT_355522 [Amanita muscaria Koide BX008]